MSEVSTDVVGNGNGGTIATAREKVAGMDSGVATIFSTIRTDSLAAKVELFTALSTAQPMEDHLDKTINLKHIVAQVVEVAQDDGSMTDAVRVIIIDEAGEAYAAISSGMFKALEEMIQVLGHPDTWNGAAIPIVVKAEKSRRGRRFFTVKMAA